MSPFVQRLQALSDEEFLFYILSVRLAPVFKGLRPSCLFCLRNTGRALYDSWKAHEEMIVAKLPLEICTLKEDEQSIHVFIYSPGKLKEVLNRRGVDLFLAKLGYGPSLQEKLDMLKAQFKHGCPHEIGLFLGYPIHDVAHFMYTKKPCLTTGYWKVFCHEQEAAKQFVAFDKAKANVINKMIRGEKPLAIFEGLCQ